MTNKLVVIINSLKVPKIKRSLLYEMKFLVPNYSCLQNTLLGSYRPQTPILSVPPQTNFLGMPLPCNVTFYALVLDASTVFEINNIINNTWQFMSLALQYKNVRLIRTYTVNNSYIYCQQSANNEKNCDFQWLHIMLYCVTEKQIV